jgi:hypothetical protein
MCYASSRPFTRTTRYKITNCLKLVDIIIIIIRTYHWCVSLWL